MTGVQTCALPISAGGACPIFNVHADADNCQSGMSCLGIEAASDGTACTKDEDCPKDEFMGNPQCVDGFCGTSFCAPRCDAKGRCTGAFAPIQVGDGEGHTTCYCAPVEVGTSQAGDACPFGGLHAAASACAAELTCLGIPASVDTDTCTTAADCPAAQYFGNAECVDGHCGASFCSPYCDDFARCTEGFYPADVGGTCLCIPTPVGTSTAHAACPIGDVNASADECAGNLLCLGIGGDSMTALCASDADCAFPNGDCVDGMCGYSYCAPYCDDAGACAVGTPIALDTGTCLCAPAQATGAAAFGDACTLGNVGLAADDCAADLDCSGVWSSAGTPACTTAADCPAAIAVPWECVQGHCGWAWCVQGCDATGACAAAGATPFAWVDGGCMCQEVGAGDVAAGQGCQFAMLNSDSGHCATGLACVAAGPAVVTEAGCATAADCPAADFRGLAGCDGDACYSTFCAAPCGTGNTCDTGFEPLHAGDLCWCQPKVAL